jgi:hypothetical protein
MSDKQLSKKKRKDIAKMWMAGVVLATGGDAIGPDLSDDDIEGILEEVEKIGNRILGDRPLFGDLTKIIKYVKQNNY